MTSKTREFKLNEIVVFENELIHFFNINPYNSSIYTSLEIDGKKIKLNNTEKIILKDVITKNENEEITYNINDDIQLKMKYKIFDKFNKKELFESFQTTMRESKARWNNQKIKNEGMKFGTGISIKDRIKMFSGGENKKKQTNTNYKPGKLKMPPMFQNSNKNSLSSTHSNISSNKSSFKMKKSQKIKIENNADKVDNNKNKEEIKDSNKNKNNNKNEIIIINNEKIESNNNEIKILKNEMTKDNYFENQ